MPASARIEDFPQALDATLGRTGPAVVGVDMVSIGPFAESFAGPPAGAAGGKSMSLGHVAIIGFGAIARDLIDILAAQERAPEHVSVLVRPGREAEVRAALGGTASVTSSLDSVLAARPDVVVECAGHGAGGGPSGRRCWPAART